MSSSSKSISRCIKNTKIIQSIAIIKNVLLGHFFADILFFLILPMLCDENLYFLTNFTKKQ